MSEELNFRDLKMDDVTVGGQSISEPAAEPAAEPTVESSVEPASQPAAEPVAEPVSKPAENTSFDNPTPEKETAREYKFKDDFIKNVVEFYEKTGDITPYLQAKLVDFNQMSDEEIMRRNLKEQYPDVSEKAFDRLFKQQVVDKFKLDADEWGEDDSELGKELLKSEASKVRQKYVDWQKGFAAPERVEDDSQAQEDAEAEEAMKNFESSVKGSELTKKLLESKRITIKDGDGEFAYELPEVNAIVDMTLDNDKFFAQFASTEGQVDFAKWYKTVAYSQNPEQFEKSLINYGKTLGRQEVTKEIKNPSLGKTPDVATEDGGDFKTGLLRAFAERGSSK
jgi:hypothetical protein